MLSWVGKRPLREVRTYPAQLVERFSVDGEASDSVDWSDWPARFDHGGLLFHGDNKEVLAYLLANGLRGKVDLVYIDPPFDSGADYVRRVKLRGASGTARLDGESYTLGEQIQYTDIWANDNYLQFMFERLMLLRELLADDGVIYLHCDPHRSHHLRCLLDEVFGEQRFRNEVIWYYSGGGASKKEFASKHDSIFVYQKTENPVFNVDEIRMDYKWTAGQRRADGSERDLDAGKLPDDVLGLDIIKLNKIMPWADEDWDFNTQKNEALLATFVRASSNPGDLVLDAFVGSGTAAAVAQRLGRRWIACDINKGAIQTTEKRLLDIMREQAAESSGQQRLIADTNDSGAESLPAQFGFTVYRVNDYDLQIQHNEAVNLAVEHLGVERMRTDTFFEGTRGKELVKIVPFDHPLTPLDLQDIEDEVRKRPQEARDILVVALGKELAADAWLADYARRSPVNKIRAIELRTDPKYGGFFEHRPASARLVLERRAGGRAKVVIRDFMSPSIIDRLREQEGVLSPQIDDWRAMVDSVMIDTEYDGQTFDITIADIPERKADVVSGSYEFELPANATEVAVRITDMLGEEVLTVLTLEQDFVAQDSPHALPVAADDPDDLV